MLAFCAGIGFGINLNMLLKKEPMNRFLSALLDQKVQLGDAELTYDRFGRLVKAANGHGNGISDVTYANDCQSFHEVTSVQFQDGRTITLRDGRYWIEEHGAPRLVTDVQVLSNEVTYRDVAPSGEHRLWLLWMDGTVQYDSAENGKATVITPGQGSAVFNAFTYDQGMELSRAIEINQIYSQIKEYKGCN